jgi:hypothetical protein
MLGGTGAARSAENLDDAASDAVMEEEELRVGARDRGSDQAAAEHDAPSAAGNGVDLRSAHAGTNHGNSTNEANFNDDIKSSKLHEHIDVTADSGGVSGLDNLRTKPKSGGVSGELSVVSCLGPTERAEWFIRPPPTLRDCDSAG